MNKLASSRVTEMPPMRPAISSRRLSSSGLSTTIATQTKHYIPARWEVRIRSDRGSQSRGAAYLSGGRPQPPQRKANLLHLSFAHRSRRRAVEAPNLDRRICHAGSFCQLENPAQKGTQLLDARAGDRETVPIGRGGMNFEDVLQEPASTRRRRHGRPHPTTAPRLRRCRQGGGHPAGLPRSGCREGPAAPQRGGGARRAPAFRPCR